MDKKTLKALKGSIKKWKDDKMEDQGIHNCPLCEEFHQDDCVGCPVMSGSKEFHCFNTPYNKWQYHHREKHLGVGYRKVLCKECSRLRKAEKKFLQSLLPISRVKTKKILGER